MDHGPTETPVRTVSTGVDKKEKKTIIKSMIRPTNGHLIIQPRKQETFLPTERGTFQEIGIVTDRPWYMFLQVGIGDEVYFDSWLSAKYPTGEGDDEFYLVPWKDVRAIKRKNGDEVPK